MRRPTVIDQLMGEYVEWGGPVVTRAEAYRDGKARGYSHRLLDWTVLARPAVAAPEDPAEHLAFLRRIQARDGIAIGG